MENIKGKVIIITGASSGIGAATAKKLAGEGAAVVLGARRTERLEELVSTIRQNGGEAVSKKTDVTSAREVQELVDTAVERYHRVDVLFNNAGLMPLSYLRDLKIDEWERMIDVNIKGVLYGIAAVLPIMRKQKSGQIINTASVAGHVVSPGGAVYSATKFAVRAISEGLRKEESPDSLIRVTSISPGAVLTELPSTITDPQLKQNIIDREKFHGISAEDIANAVAYAVSQPDGVAVNEVLVRPTTQIN
ncbi:SDR family oxidoreductase [Sporolactobacillus sp. KGMB 08714]|uniref:SDR family oxidoreductase n=1 Tax=Sporolactobacillus sp. KGMB 08714 TaxID=3064704 RepID=UPI002FBDB14E